LVAGDSNQDNRVDAVDFSTLATSFNLGSSAVGFAAEADFNADGQVDAVDFSLLASNFNQAGEEPDGQ